jgi:beta-glucosidase-like glycosyl hydrolase
MKSCILGIAEMQLTDQEKLLLKDNLNLVHGIILFSRNIDSAEQLRELTSDIKSINPDCKILIDQEGGRVARLKPPIAKKIYPNMESFRELYQHDKDAAIFAVRDNFHELMSELKSFNIDITCAPLCDIRTKDTHDIIGNRSFGYDKDIVIDLAKAALDGIHKAGGEGILKHIPGHGRSSLDSHLSLPIVNESIEILEDSDFLVFKELATCCPYAMTAHILYSNCFDDALATFSTKAINYIRNNIGFHGLLMTDDINMKALEGDTKSKTLKSLNAGCDIILECSGNFEIMSDVIKAIKGYN